jgi:hypothetical protein
VSQPTSLLFLATEPRFSSRPTWHIGTKLVEMEVKQMRSIMNWNLCHFHSPVFCYHHFSSEISSLIRILVYRSIQPLMILTLARRRWAPASQDLWHILAKQPEHFWSEIQGMWVRKTDFGCSASPGPPRYTLPRSLISNVTFSSTRGKAGLLLPPAPTSCSFLQLTLKQNRLFVGRWLLIAEYWRTVKSVRLKKTYFWYAIDIDNSALETQSAVVWEPDVGHWVYKLGHRLINFIGVVYSRNLYPRQYFVDWPPPTLIDENPSLLDPVDWGSPCFITSGHWVMMRTLIGMSLLSWRRYLRTLIWAIASINWWNWAVWQPISFKCPFYIAVTLKSSCSWATLFIFTEHRHKI